MINDLVISQIRQRLEILYQMVDELETGGGSGGTSDYLELSNKPQINNTTLEGNKTAAQLGLATSAAVAGLIDAGAKNKLNHTAYTRTVNGVNYTVNADKSITITSDGTNTQSLLYLVQNEPLAAGSYILSGCTGGSATKYDLRVKVGNTVTNNYNGGTAFTANGNPIEASIVVRAAQTLNVTIKPMISTADDYAISSKYVPYVPTTRELYEMILALQNP